MKPEIFGMMGKRAFVQSLHPYKPRKLESVAIFGLDSEYVPRLNQKSRLISWQLASSNRVQLFTSELCLKNLYREACALSPYARIFVFVTFFSLAEIQFLDLSDWGLYEYKGRYRLKQEYKDKMLIVVDLADWYVGHSLAEVAELWGFKKLDYPIVEKVEAISREELSVEQLLDDPEFREYAKHDAVLCQRIYTQIRQYFLKYHIDVILAMTPAQTSAFMFRTRLERSIEQRDTQLRRLALSCCWGGRMECIYRGGSDLVFEYDASGHHPNSAIALGILPEESNWEHTLDLKKWLDGVSGLGKVYFRFPEEEQYPCLPVFSRDSLIFPLEGVSFCSVSEARLAKELGASLILLDGYYYTKGTAVLTEYLSMLQEQRNQSENEVQRGLLKLLSNSIIGKFFQKTMEVDLARVQKYAKEHNIPYEQAICIEGVDFGQDEVRVGSCFYPEWYALILGYARANISRLSRKYNALMISSDAFATEEELSPSFTQDGITYNLKASGSYVGYRTRFYRIGEKYAHHAVHNLSASQKVLKEFLLVNSFPYQHSRLIHLKESWRVGLPFGARVSRPMSVSLGYDYKRKLLAHGRTAPWQTATGRNEFLDGAEKKRESQLTMF